MRRRWYQFTLRTMFIVITLICVVVGLYVAPKVRRHNLVLAIEAIGGDLDYTAPHADESWLTKKLRKHLPRDWFDEIRFIDLGVQPASDATLDGFETLAGMEVLRLNGAQVTDAGLVHLKGLTGLKELSLSGTEVTDAGLADLKGLTSLQGLWLQGTRVSDGGLKILKGLTSLQGLGLRGTQVTDAAVADLQKSLPKCEIIR